MEAGIRELRRPPCLLPAQCADRVDLRRPTCRNVAGHERDACEQ